VYNGVNLVEAERIVIAGTSIDLTLTSHYSPVNNREWVYDNIAVARRGESTLATISTA